MVHVIKVCLADSKSGVQIRRLTVSSDIASNYKLLKEKVQDLFHLQNDFEMQWIDSESDYIYMSSDEELAQALANVENGIFRVFLSLKDGVQTKPKTPEVSEKTGVEHPLVTCDGCEKFVFGDRYKCLQCKNFDLCTICHGVNKHPDHDMIKLVKPTYMPREWVFCGARKIWKSMFGYAAGNVTFLQDKEEHKCPHSPKANQETPKRPCNNHQGMPDVFANLLNGDLSEAHKLLTEGFGTFMNLLPAGIEVKMDQKPFKAECKVKTCSKKGKAKKCGAAENSSENKEEKKVDKTAIPDQPKKAEVAAEPKKEETLPEPIQLKKVETFEALPTPAQPAGLFAIPQPDATTPPDIGTTDISVDDGLQKHEAETTKVAECREKSPVSDETANGAEGWTFIHGYETSKPEPSCASNASIENATEAVKDVHYPKLDEIKSKMEEGNVIQTSDPKIINALIKMQAMGFTNEGGWLERLLVTKHGNINEALDALYPFSQRH